MTKTEIIVRETTTTPATRTLVALSAVPEEEFWIAKHKSARTRRAYRLDATHFMRDPSRQLAG
jgi:hypothetical protein